MQFQSSFITQAGSNLFASATSSTNGDPSTPIVWMYARTYNLDTSGYSPDAMRALDASALTNGSGNKQTSIGNVTSAVPATATDSSSGVSVQIPAVRLTCELSNTNTYYGLARNLAVFAKLNGQPDTNAVLAAIARVDTGHHVDEIPSKSDADFSATIDFVLAIKDSQINTIQAPASYYASAQTVQALADRVVTTHLANDTTTGESQNIYGVKTFKDKTYHNNNIVPSANNAYSLGMLDANNSSNDRRWNTVYATTFNGTTFTGTAAIATNLEASPELTWTTASSSSAGSTLQVKAGGKNSNSVTIDKVQKAYSPYISAGSDDANYYIVLGGSITAGATFTAGFKNLYADSVNSFYYNTSTNKLTCPVFSGNVVTQYIAECTTAKGTADKTATINDFTLTAGTRVFIKFTKGNSATSPTLNISSKGAKDINHLRVNLPANSIVPFIYNGSSWDVEGSFSTVASVDVRGNDSSSAYPIIFASAFGTDTTTYVRRSLYTGLDSNDVLKYNPKNNICYCKTFSGSLSGNATSATKATQDGSGNTITSYYCTLSTEQSITGVKHITPTGYNYSFDIGKLETAPNSNFKEATIQPVSDGYCFIGTSSKRFKAIYAKEVDCNKLGANLLQAIANAFNLGIVLRVYDGHSSGQSMSGRINVGDEIYYLKGQRDSTPYGFGYDGCRIYVNGDKNTGTHDTSNHYIVLSINSVGTFGTYGIPLAGTPSIILAAKV